MVARARGTRRSSGRVFALLGVVAQLGLAAASLSADGTAGPNAPEVMAAMIYKFALFVEWPDGEGEVRQAPFVIGVLGEDPVTRYLDTVTKDKTHQKRRIQVRQLATPGDAKTCQILFISASERKHLQTILTAVGGAAVLTVGEMEAFAESGGMVNFTLEDNRIHFEINEQAAAQAGLKISSRLLSLAKVVKDARPGGRH